MNIWIITIGNSDVQLWTKDHWTNLQRTVRGQLDDRGFTPTEGTDDRFLVPGRVMGTVYSQSQAQDYWDDLAFPLLDNFVGLLREENIEIDQIILILTDQETLFSRSQRRSTQSAYWQDTCTLEPIVATYLKHQLPQAQLKRLLLQPQSPTEGLDDWDSVLKLIQSELAQLDFPDAATIYVSHQASTPAISSAVQFETLLRFGHRVQFLVTSERDKELTKILKGSTYLRGIRQQEAKTLLERYDYSGVKALLAPYLKTEVGILLDAAIQWNSAKFDDFAKKVLEYPDNQLRQAVQERTTADNWWWTGYEAAYLGVVRLEQGNTVEAFFHSFRAVEGLIRLFADAKYKDKIEFNKHGAPYIKFSNKNCFNLYGRKLYEFLEYHYCKSSQPIDPEKDKDIWQFGEVTFDKRNQYFHQLFGLSEQDVFDAWDTDNRMDWEARVLGCLNFIAEPDSPFTALDTASLMYLIQGKLEEAIAQIAQS
ncbi:hypothetical protein [Coleofasciculus sp.]|uniref:hypothetical protein n=1 Tax=Coleofasciculus sp. TaxID=3100458 RepID=UPI003A17F794